MLYVLDRTPGGWYPRNLTTRKDDTMTKSIAKALYLELRKGYRTAQIIVIPGFAETSTTPSNPMQVLTRQISEAHPRKSWRFYSSNVPTNIYKTDEVQLGISQTVPFIQDIEHYFRGFADANWDLYKSPIAIELTYDDVREVSTHNTPQAFMRRLNRARVGAGYDESLFTASESTTSV
jgi:hypothetical protein